MNIPKLFGKCYDESERILRCGLQAVSKVGEGNPTNCTMK